MNIFTNKNAFQWDQNLGPMVRILFVLFSLYNFSFLLMGFHKLLVFSLPLHN